MATCLLFFAGFASLKFLSDVLHYRRVDFDNKTLAKVLFHFLLVMQNLVPRIEIRNVEK